MTACEKCWADAYWEATIHGTTQVDEYQRLLALRGEGQCWPTGAEGFQ